RLLEVLGRRLREAVARGAARAGGAADPARRVLAGADEPLGVLGRVAVREDQPLDAGVEVAEEQRRLAVRDPGQGGGPDALGGAGQVPHGLGSTPACSPSAITKSKPASPTNSKSSG